jgi:hypothetical protein
VHWSELNSTYPGNCAPNKNGNVIFNALRQNNRAGLALSGNAVYAAWASHGDKNPYKGWLLAFNMQNLQRLAAFNVGPDTTHSVMNAARESGKPVPPPPWTVRATFFLRPATGISTRTIPGWITVTASSNSRSLAAVRRSCRTAGWSWCQPLRRWEHRPSDGGAGCAVHLVARCLPVGGLASTACRSVTRARTLSSSGVMDILGQILMRR